MLLWVTHIDVHNSIPQPISTHVILIARNFHNVIIDVCVNDILDVLNSCLAFLHCGASAVVTPYHCRCNGDSAIPQNLYCLQQKKNNKNSQPSLLKQPRSILFSVKCLILGRRELINAHNNYDSLPIHGIKL